MLLMLTAQSKSPILQTPASAGNFNTIRGILMSEGITQEKGTKKRTTKHPSKINKKEKKMSGRW